MDATTIWLTLFVDDDAGRLSPKVVVVVEALVLLAYFLRMFSMLSDWMS